jgi:predicted enzyme related to lactoylglutathione lyase
MQRVTGLGGFFIRSKDPKTLCAWYEKHLGVPFAGNTYAGFKWVNENNPEVPGSTVFSFFNENTDYFDPSEKQCMVNFRVKDLRALLAALKEEGVWVDEKVEEYDYGKFGWTMDPEGNKIELWEPVDGIF